MATVTKAANRHSVGTTGWTNPSNAFATTGDDVYATGTPPKGGAVSGYFGFSDFTSSDIPDGSTINSVTVTAECGMTALVTGGKLSIQARLNNSNQTPTEKTTIVEEQITAAFSPLPTLAELRVAETSDTVEAALQVQKGSTNSAMTGQLDFVSITVDYTPPATPASLFLPNQFPRLIRRVRSS